LTSRQHGKSFPYLKLLGVSDLYASPIFQARKGSTHGYDVVDPTQINCELGGIEKFEVLWETLHQQGIGWIQDIVPNHMAL
jgi:(1->4)-alpha-D-glucan 1-alpha-D-glucosylmutase